IPVAERIGDLAVVPYTLADCLIRLAPTEVDDALAAGKLTEAMNAAAEALNGFIGAQPTAPQTPDAHIELRYCYTRLGDVTGQPRQGPRATRLGFPVAVSSRIGTQAGRQAPGSAPAVRKRREQPRRPPRGA